MSLHPGGFYYQVAQEYFGTSTPEKHLVKKCTIFGLKILETFVLCTFFKQFKFCYASHSHLVMSASAYEQNDKLRKNIRNLTSTDQTVNIFNLSVWNKATKCISGSSQLSAMFSTTKYTQGCYTLRAPIYFFVGKDLLSVKCWINTHFIRPLAS